MKMVEEGELVERLAPLIEERIRYKIVRSIIDALEEQFYPPEEMFRAEFVKRVEEAEKRVKEGKSTRYNYDEFKKEFLAEV
ncbi:MAG: DUF2683 family protein [Methanosarcinales archaeon]